MALQKEPTIESSAGPKRFMPANGQNIGQYGSNTVKFGRQGGADVMSLCFDVMDVTRPLVAVRRMVELGNEVHFDGDGGWIRNVARASLLVDASGFIWQA